MTQTLTNKLLKRIELAEKKLNKEMVEFEQALCSQRTQQLLRGYPAIEATTITIDRLSNMAHLAETFSIYTYKTSEALNKAGQTMTQIATWYRALQDALEIDEALTS